MKKKGTYLYQQVQDYVLDQIREGMLCAGDRIPSEQDLSEQMKVSRLTVRKAYAAMIDAGILSAVQGKGTFVSEVKDHFYMDPSAGKQRGGAIKSIGVIFPEITYFFGPVLKGIEEYASSSQYILNIMFNDTPDRESRSINAILANGTDGVIINPQRTFLRQDTRNYRLLKEAGVPTVMVGKPPIDVDMDCVMFNSDAGAFDGVARLIADGHRRILHLYHSGHDLEALSERRNGYTKAINMLTTGSEPITLDCNRPDWKLVLEQMASGSGAITAVFSDSDSFAVQAYLHLVRRGILHIGLKDFVAYNDSDACRQFKLSMPLIEIPKIEMGRCAVEMLKDRFSVMRPLHGSAIHAVFRPRTLYGESGR